MRLSPLPWIRKHMRNPKPAPVERPHVRLRVRFLPFAVGLLVFLQLFFPNKIWFTFLIAFGGLWLIAWFWARSLAGGLFLQREFRFGWAQVGDELEDRFSISNNGIMPAVWVEILDKSTLPSYDPSYVTSVGGFGSYRWHSKAVCSRRGVYTLGPTTFRSGDPFGIYVTERRYPASSTMAVMPPLLPLPAVEVAPGGHAGDGRPVPGRPSAPSAHRPCATTSRATVCVGFIGAPRPARIRSTCVSSTARRWEIGGSSSTWNG